MDDQRRSLTGGWESAMMNGVWVRSTFARSACSQLYCKHMKDDISLLIKVFTITLVILMHQLSLLLGQLNEHEPQGAGLLSGLQAPLLHHKPSQLLFAGMIGAHLSGLLKVCCRPSAESLDFQRTACKWPCGHEPAPNMGCTFVPSPAQHIHATHMTLQFRCTGYLIIWEPSPCKLYAMNFLAELNLLRANRPQNCQLLGFWTEKWWSACHNFVQGQVGSSHQADICLWS